MKEAANRTGFGVTVVSEGPVSDALKRALLKLRIGLLSNHPKRRRYLARGRITVDA